MTGRNPGVVLPLDSEQQEAVLAPLGPVCVLAGAGTGKTRAITARIAHQVCAGVAPAGTFLAVTFTTRAAGEMRGRLRRLGAGDVQARTFHSAALRQLTYFWPQVVGGEPPRVVESKAALLMRGAAAARLQLSPAEIRDVAGEIEWAKSTLAGPDEYATAAAVAGRTPPGGAAVLADLFRRYESVKRSAGACDFEDILLLTCAFLEENQEVARQVQGRYRNFVVDEYQDVTPLQQRLLDAWLGGRDSVCVVGDAAQTIYSFTGASHRFLLGFPARYPDAVVVRLVRSYRSTPEVVALANRVLAGAAMSAPARLRLEAQSASGPAPVFTACPDEPAEAASVAAAIRRLVDAGTPASEIAVLFRTNAQSAAFESALTAGRIPFVVRGAARFFERPEVREALVALRRAAKSGDADRPSGLADQVVDVLAGVGWRPGEPPAGAGAEAERWQHLAALAALAEELAAASPQADLEQFVADLAVRAAEQHVPTVDGVTLASLHAAKGLEWDAVFLVGLTDGMVPIAYATGPAEVEEERRLFYVGITRARRHLTLTWAGARVPGGRRLRQSRFLTTLAGTAAASGVSGGRDGSRDLANAAGSGAGARTVMCMGCGRRLSGPVAARLRRCPGCPASPDWGEAEHLLVRLQRWRAERARELSQPAFCILPDSALLALSDRQPTDAAGLVAIPGIGQGKLNRFGADILGIVAGANGGG
ncbi:MAG: ATP-dependent DNA helicase UvrD2 [Frankiaceae bacterium]